MFVTKIQWSLVCLSGPQQVRSAGPVYFGGYWMLSITHTPQHNVSVWRGGGFLMLFIANILFQKWNSNHISSSASPWYKNFQLKLMAKAEKSKNLIIHTLKSYILRNYVSGNCHNNYPQFSPFDCVFCQCMFVFTLYFTVPVSFSCIDNKERVFHVVHYCQHFWWAH